MQDNRENKKYKTAPLRVKGRLNPFSFNSNRQEKKLHNHWLGIGHINP